MLEAIITYLAATFRNSMPYIQEVQELAEKISEERKEYPAIYCTNGDYEPISSKENYLYFRKLGDASESEDFEDSVSGCDYLITRVYPMAAVAYIPKNILQTDNKYIDDKISSNIANILKEANYATLETALKADDIYAEVRSIVTDRTRVWNEEHRNIDMAARLDHVYCRIEFDLVIVATESCLRNWECGDSQVVVDGDTIIFNISDLNAWHKTGDVQTMYQDEVFKTKAHEFAATDSYSVDANGDVVEEGGIMTEYDWYNQFASQDVSLNNLLTQAVQKLDQNGRFDV